MYLKNNKLITLPEKEFTSLPGERFLFLTRKHWYVILSPLILITFTLVVLISFSFVAFLIFLKLPFVFLTIAVMSIAGAATLSAKVVVDWYFHIYIVTSRKILDVACRPLFSHVINDVLLNQVRCTEIDVKINGILKELLDVGDVIVTFDRPTHQEEFVFSDVKNPRWLGAVLSESLDFIQKTDSRSSWYKDKNGKANYRFMDEIVPEGWEVN